MSFFPPCGRACLRARLAALALIFLISSACSVSPELPVKKPVVAPTLISVVAVGDMMLGTNFPKNRLANDDGKGLLSQVVTTLAGADIIFGNLEGSLLAEGEPRKQCKDMNRCYLFRSPPHYAEHFKQAGFNVLSLANNHAQDFGAEGAQESMRHLAKAGIQHTGQEGDIASWTAKGLNIAVIAYAPFIGSHDFLDTKKAQQQIKELASLHDVVVVSMHAGGEGLDALHVPFKEEFFYGENRGDVVAFAHAVIDAGADLVIGHGPHVPRALELYKDRLIAYSLGNFCTYSGISIVGNKGLAPILKLSMDDHGRFITGKIVSARQLRPVGTVLDDSHQAAQLIKKLTEQDFSQTNLAISEEGHIKRKAPLAKSLGKAQ